MSALQIALITACITVGISILVGLILLVRLWKSPGDKTFFIPSVLYMGGLWLLVTLIVSAVTGCIAAMISNATIADFNGSWVIFLILILGLLIICRKPLASCASSCFSFIISHGTLVIVPLAIIGIIGFLIGFFIVCFSILNIFMGYEYAQSRALFITIVLLIIAIKPLKLLFDSCTKQRNKK